MVASKIDVANPEKVTKLKRWCTRKKLKLYPISGGDGRGDREAEVRDGGSGGTSCETP